MNWQEQSHKEIYLSVGKRIRSMRVSHGYSQKELAKESGLGRTTIFRIEKGESISFDAIIRIFRVFHTLDRFETLFDVLELSPMKMYLKDGSKSA